MLDGAVVENDGGGDGVGTMRPWEVHSPRNPQWGYSLVELCLRQGVDQAGWETNLEALRLLSKASFACTRLGGFPPGGLLT